MITEQLGWKPYTDMGHLEAKDAEGLWMIAPSGPGQPASIGFQLYGWTAKNYAELMASYKAAEDRSREKAVIGNRLGIGCREYGYGETEDDAKTVIEVLRTGDVSITAEEALGAAGFAFAPNPYIEGDRRYKLKSSNGVFSVAIEDNTVGLRHDRRGSRYSDPLFRLTLTQPTFDGKGTVWHILPDRVDQNFVSLAVQAAIKVAQDYAASGRNRARRQRARL